VWCDATDLAARLVPPDQEMSMGSYAGYAVMGSKPTAGNARLLACVASSASASTIREWQIGTAVTATPMFTDVADTHRHRRPPDLT
jgi:hypothetical protein